MALPPIVLAAEEPVRLISPYDPALDAEATGEARYLAYCTGEDLDVSTLVLREGVELTWFEVQALGPRESRVLRSLLPEVPAVVEGVCEHGDCAGVREAYRARGDAAGPAGRCFRASGAWWVEVMALTVQLALRSVTGWPGWEKATREQYLGLPRWPAATIAAIPEGTTTFLGTAIGKLSTLSAEKKSVSGSSLTPPDGIDARRTATASAKAPAPSTPARARGSARGRRGARA